MTGFGRGEAVGDGVLWRVEASSVNRKQLEVVVQLPRELGELEPGLRNLLAGKLSRGRVQVSISSDRGQGGGATLSVNEALAEAYGKALGALSTRLGLPGEPTVADMVRWPGVFTLAEGGCKSEEALPLIEKALDQAVAALLVMRHAEGLNLKADIHARLDLLTTMLREAAAISPQVVARYREALAQRLAESGLPLPLDDDRLVKEIALFADRCDISEEITRATSHIEQFRTYMESGEPVGRPLDFLSQELFREFNTMGSKANHAQLAQLVVKAKTELEKIREQVQNIE